MNSNLSLWDKICLKVSEFNYLFGVINYNYDPKNTKTILNLFDKTKLEFNETQVKLRYNLIKEESFELIDSIEKKDSIEIIDALCDILYVVAGAKVYWNFSNENINLSLSKTNLDKATEQFSDLTNESIYKINKILDIDDNEFLRWSDQLKYLNLQLQHLTEQIIDKYNNFNLELTNEYNKILDLIIGLVFEISTKIEINIFKLFMIVHLSNMSKVCESEDIAIKTVEWYKHTDTKYSDVNFRHIEFNNKNYWIIYDQTSKKILKSINYTPTKFI